MSNETDVQLIEVSIEEANKQVNLGKALDKLHKNREFKQIILEGFFKEEAIRLVGLKAHPAMQDEAQQAAILKEIDAIGSLRNYFGKIYQGAAMADQSIISHEQELEALRAEGVAE